MPTRKAPSKAEKGQRGHECLRKTGTSCRAGYAGFAASRRQLRRRAWRLRAGRGCGPRFATVGAMQAQNSPLARMGAPPPAPAQSSAKSPTGGTAAPATGGRIPGTAAPSTPAQRFQALLALAAGAQQTGIGGPIPGSVPGRRPGTADVPVNMATPTRPAALPQIAGKPAPPAPAGGAASGLSAAAKARRATAQAASPDAMAPTVNLETPPVVAAPPLGALGFGGAPGDSADTGGVEAEAASSASAAPPKAGAADNKAAAPDTAAIATAAPAGHEAPPPAVPQAEASAGNSIPAAPAADGLSALAATGPAPGAAAASQPPSSGSAAPQATAPAPAAQVAQAVAGVHIAPGAGGQVTIHMQPIELGAVQVRIERAHDGSAIVTVQVERADTLHALQQDLPHLHQALDQAGLPTAQRQISLHLAPATSGDTGTGLGAGTDGQRQGQPPRQTRVTSAPTDEEPDSEPIKWQPAGINITA